MGERQPTTDERPASQTRDEVVREAKRIEEGLLYSSKGHFAASHFWSNFHLWIGIPMVVLSALAGATALSAIDPSHIVAGLLSIVVAVLSAVATFLNANERVSAHLSAGNSYDALMNKVRIFWAIDCWRDESEQVLTERLKYFSEQKDDLNRKCPQIPRWAYKKGKTGILSGEATYRVDVQNQPPERR